MSARRILLFAPALGAGGAERVLAILANAWASAGREVALVTLAGAGRDFFPLAPEVQRIGLDLVADSRSPTDALAHNLCRVWRLRQAIRRFRPGAMIGFCDQANVLLLLASRGLPGRVIVSERTDPGRHGIGRPWSALRRLVYPSADAVVVQTETVAGWLREHIGGARPVVIPNPVLAPVPGAGPLPSRGGAVGIVIGVGRLSAEKGFDRLLQAFAAVRPEFPGWRLRLLGDGPCRADLEAAAARLELADQVEFLGQVPDPAAHLAIADLFVLPSRYEGFPNALLEAMAAGLPAVAFDCRSGPAAILRPGIDGLLVPADRVDELARAMAGLMAAPAERRRLGTQAVAVLERFGLERVLADWEVLLGEGAR